MDHFAAVKLWDRSVGAVALDEAAGYCVFEYDPVFVAGGLEVAPLMMPLAPKRYAFPDLPEQTFHGLPGLLADSLPDTFGTRLSNLIIN